MTAKKIEKLLRQALLNEGQMQYRLYEHELEERLDDLQSSLTADQDDYIFTVTENNGDVASTTLLVLCYSYTHNNISHIPQ